jgi:twitching motility protein PilT
MKLDELLDLAIAREASDVLLSPGYPVSLRVRGLMSFLSDTPLTAEHCRKAVDELVGPGSLARLREEHDLDFAVAYGSRRFRGAAYLRDGEPAIALRTIAAEPPSPEALRLPAVMLELMRRPHGLLLFTGATGTGKSTSQASLLAWLTRQVARHVVTIEDPIEYVIPAGRSVIDQRQIGPDARSFARALRHVVRARPDVVVVGEMRDLTTFRTVLALAETGHLVLSTLHTGDAAMAIPRFVGGFPASAQPIVRQQLAGVLLGVLNQRLVRRHDGTQVGAYEVLVNTPGVARMIREAHDEQIPTQMEIDRPSGMKTLNRALQDLVDAGEIDAHEAERHAIARESRI